MGKERFETADDYFAKVKPRRTIKDVGYYNVAQIAELVDLDPQTVRRQIESGGYERLDVSWVKDPVNGRYLCPADSVRNLFTNYLLKFDSLGSPSIRETTDEDFRGISTLLRDTKLSDYFSEDGFRKMLDRNRGYCYVAEAGERIVGNVFATHDGAFVGYVRKVAVAEDYRRQGIASRLLETVAQKLEADGISLIFAHVEKGNEASIEMFKSLGFEIRDSHYLIDRSSSRRD